MIGASSALAGGGLRAASLSPTRGEWMRSALQSLDGEDPDLQTRALTDLVTADNPGAVPPAFSAELVGVIDQERPFLASGRRLNAPDAGMTLIVPEWSYKATAGMQHEKYELTSTGTMVPKLEIPGVTVAGAGDLSIQVLKRSTPAFLDLYLKLLAEAYAHQADAIAVAAMLAGVGITDGGPLTPANFQPGEAWELAAQIPGSVRLWLSTAGVEAFLDAKETGTGASVYQRGLKAPIGGMTPTHVPALDGTGVDAVVGPTAGIFYAEATYTLQADVPSKAGRNVALVGILWVNAGAGSTTTFAL